MFMRVCVCVCVFGVLLSVIWCLQKAKDAAFAPRRSAAARVCEDEGRRVEAAASDFNKFDGFPFATQTQSSIRSKKFRITLRGRAMRAVAAAAESCLTQMD